MLRIVVIAAVLMFVVAYLTRSTLPKRILWAMFAIAVVYTILKATGVIEAMAPDRMGAIFWGIGIPKLQDPVFA